MHLFVFCLLIINSERYQQDSPHEDSHTDAVFSNPQFDFEAAQIHGRK